MESIDHDMYIRIDEILSIENEFKEFNTPLVNHPEPELYSKIDPKELKNVFSYDSNKPISKSDEFLILDSIWSIPFELFTKFEDPSHGIYFSIFYNEFSNVLMPVKGNDRNPVRDILLSYAMRKDYLYYAILASGSRYSHQNSFLEKDQLQYSIFMKKTSQMLDDLTFIQNYKPQNDAVTYEVVHHKLEPLLLTILLLTSDNAASMEQTWRGHLRGAKELLQKVFLNKTFPITKTLIFCKNWFSSFEILAGLGAPYGGTLVQETELESLIINVDSLNEITVLKSLNIVNEDNYNYLFGFHNDLLPPLLSLIHLIRSIFKKEVKSFSSNEIFSLINQFQNNSHVRIGKSINDSCYANAGLLTIFTKFLEIPITNPVNQELVHKILGQIEILLKDETNSYQLMLLHWPVLVAGLNCNSDRYIIDTFFEVLIRLGAGSAKHTLNKIKRTWNHESDTDYVDIVTY